MPGTSGRARIVAMRFSCVFVDADVIECAKVGPKEVEGCIDIIAI